MAAMFRRLLPLLALFTLLLAACSGMPKVRLDMKKEYANAVRWSDWDAAWKFTDPAQRTSLILPLEMQDRYKDIKVTGYQLRTSEVQPDGTIEQTVEIRYVDQNTQIEKTLRYREVWRTDDEGAHWWLTTGLPEF